MAVLGCGHYRLRLQAYLYRVSQQIEVPQQEKIMNVLALLDFPYLKQKHKSLCNCLFAVINIFNLLSVKVNFHCWVKLQIYCDIRPLC